MSVTPLAEGTIPSEIGFPANSLCSESSRSVHNLKQPDVFDSLNYKGEFSLYLHIGSLGGGLR